MQYKGVITMMKRIFSLLLTALLCMSSASATILPPAGVSEGYKAWTGIEATPAVVLCESLTVYDQRGDQGGKKVSTILYTGTARPVLDSWDGWAQIQYSDGAEPGWVRSDYLLMDPAWYLCDEGVQVYAYPDTMSPRVALLGTGDELPIITQYDTEYEGWVCVSLRGAAGWIRKTPKDTVNDTWFRPEMLADITGAVLECGGEAAGSADPTVLNQLAVMLTNVEDKGGPMAGCPFMATLTLMLADGRKVELQLATDSCCVYRVDGRDYAYARNLFDPYEGAPDNSVLFGLFGTSAEITWAGN